MACVWGMAAMTEVPGYHSESETWLSLLDPEMAGSPLGQYIAVGKYLCLTWP